MSDIRSNNLPALAKVIESAQSGYTPKGLGERTASVSQSQALTLNVISANNNVVVLQVQNTTQRFTIDRQALQGLNASTSLQNGDKLVLMGSSQKLATFALEQVQSSPLKGLSQPVLQALSQQWPDISAAMLKKALPGTLNQMNLSSTSPVTQRIAATFIDIAVKSGQPQVQLKLDATVVAVGNTTFTIDVANSPTSSRLRLVLPLNNELVEALTLKSKVSLNFDVNNKLSPLTTLLIDNKVDVSNKSLASLNDSLIKQEQALKSILSQLLINDQVAKPKLGLVIPANNTNFSALGSNVKQLLNNNVSSEQLQTAKIVLTQSSQVNQGHKNAHLQLSLLAKPILLGIEPEKLGALNDMQSVSKGSSDKVPGIKVGIETLAASTGQSAGQRVNAQQTGGNDSPIIKDSLKNNLLMNLLKMTNDSTHAQAQLAANQKIDSLQGLISNELNQTLAHSMGVSKSMPELVSQLKQLQGKGGAELNNFVSSILQQTHLHNASQALNSDIDPMLDGDTHLQNVEQLKQIFTSNVLPNIHASPIQSVTGVNAGGGLINGLVTMLQASLQAKLIAQQPQFIGPIQNAQMLVANAANAKGVRPTIANTKALTDLNKADPRGNLIGELNKVLSNHSMHKLAAAESSLQGQDSFYYALPNLFSPDHKDIEIVIHKEQKQADENQEQSKQNQWQLNMKLDIGDSGEVLAKVKLINEQVDLHLYASNEALKNKIHDYLPYLNRRLVALGLTVNQKCFVGKIPDKLYKTEFQVVQAYV